MPPPEGRPAAPRTWSPGYTLEERFRYFWLPRRLSVGWLLRKHLRHGEPELHLLPRIVPRERIAVDVGANKGVYTHLLARLCRRVEAFEPNPKVYRILTRNLPGNARVHPVALADRAGEAELYVPRNKRGYSSQTASLHPRRRAGGAGVVRVRRDTLDSFGLRDVGFVKIDVEGLELEVVEGAAETLARDRPVLQVEIEEQHTGRCPLEAIGLLAQLGYDACFLRDAALAPATELDHAANAHRAGGPGYVNNFVFLPRA